jgi:hypothetical protein
MSRGARYTHDVGNWQTRLVSFLLIGVLAGAPAITAVCDAACSGSSQPIAHGGMCHADEVAARHDHHPSVDTAATVAPLDFPRVSGSPGADCCGTLAQPGPSLTASRGDTSLLPSPHVAVALSESHLDGLGQQTAGLRHASPPGGFSPDRGPLVLRI